MSEQQARIIGGYRLGRRIAVGGMAEVFEARREDARAEQGWPLVLKLMLPAAGDPAPDFVRMFADEGRIAAALDHEHLVRVLEHGVEGEQPYIAMERVDGASLARLLDKGGALPPPLALGVAEALLEALEHIHGRTDDAGRPLQIVHRDVTPGNVLLSRQGAIKLGDFGIARSRLQQVRTRTGVIKGTVQYMAPEQVTDSGVDQRTDIYGVGLLLFEMLCGRPLLEAEREVDLIRLAESPTPVKPSSIEPAVSPALDQLVAPALARFPEERYASAASFLAALRKARQQADYPEFEAAALGARVDELAPAAKPPAEGPAVNAGAAVVTVRPRRGLARAALLGAVLGALGLIGLGVRWLVHEPVSEAPATADARAEPASVVDAARAFADAAATRARVDGAPTVDAGMDLAWLSSPTRVARRRLGVGKRPRRPRRDAGPAPAVDAALSPSPWPGQCRARLAAARRALKGRGVLPVDLPAPLGKRLAEARKGACAAGQHGPARLTALESALGGVTVDRGFVQRKLSRVDARLKRLPSSRRDRARLRERAGLALQAFLDGQYDVANRRLNQLLKLLGK